MDLLKNPCECLLCQKREQYPEARTSKAQLDIDAPPPAPVRFANGSMMKLPDRPIENRLRGEYKFPVMPVMKVPDWAIEYKFPVMPEIEHGQTWNEEYERCKLLEQHDREGAERQLRGLREWRVDPVEVDPEVADLYEAFLKWDGKFAFNSLQVEQLSHDSTCDERMVDGVHVKVHPYIRRGDSWLEPETKGGSIGWIPRFMVNLVDLKNGVWTDEAVRKNCARWNELRRAREETERAEANQSKH